MHEISIGKTGLYQYERMTADGERTRVAETTLVTRSICEHLLMTSIELIEARLPNYARVFEIGWFKAKEEQILPIGKYVKKALWLHNSLLGMQEILHVTPDSKEIVVRMELTDVRLLLNLENNELIFSEDLIPKFNGV